MSEEVTSQPTGVTVALLGDLHVGSTLGLMPPNGVKIGDEGERMPSRAQLWLWKCWERFVDRVKTTSQGRRLYVVVNGDVIDGKSHQSAQVWTDNMYYQREAAVTCLNELADADEVFFIRGTAAHTGIMAQHEEAIADELVAEPCPEGTHSWWTLLADFGGQLFDIAHHPQFNSRVPWMHGGAAVRLASAAVMQYGGRRQRIPDFVVRSHVHRFQDSGTNVMGCRGLILPCWQLRTEYAHRIASPLPDIGGIIIDCDPGLAPRVYAELYEPEATKPWQP